MRSPSLFAAVLSVPCLLGACGSETTDIPPPGESDIVGEAAPSAESRAPGTEGGEGETPARPPGNPSPESCGALMRCEGTTGPNLGEKRAWTRQTNRYIASTGRATHRGHDVLAAAGEPQWVLGKFAYGYVDTDVDGEEVDIYVERRCQGAWEKLGTTKTTDAGNHAPVDGLEDDGGRVYFEIPKGKELAPGRHRVRMVVAADYSFADTFLEVAEKGAPVLVADVDGTLTESDTAEYKDLATGGYPASQPGAAAALQMLAKKGTHIVYLSTRPEWLMQRTRDFLAHGGFPVGTVRTSPDLTGIATQSGARDFKAKELGRLDAASFDIRWGIGNQWSDARAFEAARIPADYSLLLRYEGRETGGRRFEAFSEVMADFEADKNFCQ